MEAPRDLVPRSDPKGGSPKTPLPIPVERAQRSPIISQTEVLSNDSSALWRTIACSLIAVNVTALAGFFAFGVDNVKHSEVDGILAVRAPYVHDKSRIDDNFKFLTGKLVTIDNELAKLHEEIYRLDKDDTNISKWTNAEQNAKLSQMEQRVERLEKDHPVK